MKALQMSCVIVLGGLVATTGCRDFSQVNFGRDMAEGGVDSVTEPTCSGLVTTMMDGTNTCRQMPKSCQTLAETCGPSAAENCCQYSPAVGSADSSETFDRGYDRSLPGGATQDGIRIQGARNQGEAPAHLNAYFLDRYEVTLGRFRRFYEDYGSVNNDLAREYAGAYPPSVKKNGWNLDWTGNSMLYAQTKGALLDAIVPCNNDLATGLTTGTSSHDTEPMTCVTWYEAFLFCYWDGGHLPSEAQWSFAAAGGTEGRPYPWVELNQSPATLLDIPAGYANVAGVGPGTVQPVGTYSKPGKWQHYDLAGNVWEYVLDACSGICDQYAQMGITVTDPMTLLDLTYGSGVVRGGSYFGPTYTAPFARTAFRKSFSRATKALRDNNTGFRCAREP